MKLFFRNWLFLNGKLMPPNQTKKPKPVFLHIIDFYRLTEGLASAKDPKTDQTCTKPNVLRATLV